MILDTSAIDVLLYIALSEEFNDLSDELIKELGEGFRPQELEDLAITVFYGKIFSPALNRYFQLLVVPAGKMGITRAASVISPMLGKYHVCNLVVLGISGSLSSDLQPGDVFIPDSVNEYLANSATKGKGKTWTFETSGNHLPTSPRLLNRFQMFQSTERSLHERWSQDCAARFAPLIEGETKKAMAEAGFDFRSEIRLFVGDDRKLASGPAVGKGRAFVDWIKEEVDRKVAAMDMESAGIYDAALIQIPAPRVIAIRGISDFADERKKLIEHAAKDQFRAISAKNALSLLLRGIEAGLFKEETKTYSKNQKLLSVIFVIVLLAAVLLFFLFMPKGDLSLAVSEEFNNYKEKIVKNYQTAVARTQDILEYHSKLSLKLDSRMVRNPIPGQRLEDVFRSSNFSDSVNLGFKFDVSEKTLKLWDDLKHKILEFVYGFWGRHDYFLVVMNYEEIPPPTSPPSSGPSTAAAPQNLAKMIVYLYPLEKRGKEIPDESPSSLNELRNQLAFYIYECFWPHVEDVPENTVPIEELSHDLVSLKHTVIGFDIFRKGVGHSACKGLSPEDCIRQARKELEKAFSIDSENSHASFGLGIVFLRQAVDARKNGASAYTIGTFLVKAGNYIYIARNTSAFLRNLTESQDWHRILGQWPEYKDLRVTNDFIDTIDNYRKASIKFAKADYEDALDLVTKVKNVPPDFSGLLKSFEYETKLYLAKNPSEASQLLQEFKQWSEANQSDPGWKQSYAVHSCRFKIDIEDALRSLDRAIDEANGFPALCYSYVLKGQCLARIGRHEEARKVTIHVIENLNKKKTDQEEYMSVYLDLGYMFAILKDYETATKYFIRASRLWKGYIDNVRHSVDLEDYRINGRMAYQKFNRTIVEHYHEKEKTSKN